MRRQQAAVRIQKWVRRDVARRHYLAQRKSAITIQSAARGMAARKRYSEMRRQKAAVQLQVWHAASFGKGTTRPPGTFLSPSGCCSYPQLFCCMPWKCSPERAPCSSEPLREKGGGGKPAETSRVIRPILRVRISLWPVGVAAPQCGEAVQEDAQGRRPAPVCLARAQGSSGAQEAQMGTPHATTPGSSPPRRGTAPLEHCLPCGLSSFMWSLKQVTQACVGLCSGSSRPVLGCVPACFRCAGGQANRGAASGKGETGEAAGGGIVEARPGEAHEGERLCSSSSAMSVAGRVWVHTLPQPGRGRGALLVSAGLHFLRTHVPHTGVLWAPLGALAGWVWQADLEDIRDKQSEELEGLKGQLEHAKAEVERSRKSVEVLEQELAQHKAAAKAAAKEAQEATARAEEAQAAAAAASAAAAAALAEGLAAAQAPSGGPPETVVKTVVKEVVRVVELPGSAAQPSGDTESLRATVSLGSSPPCAPPRPLLTTPGPGRPAHPSLRGRPAAGAWGREGQAGAGAAGEHVPDEGGVPQVRRPSLALPTMPHAVQPGPLCLACLRRAVLQPSNGGASAPALQRCLTQWQSVLWRVAEWEEQMRNLEQENQVLRKQALGGRGVGAGSPGAGVAPRGPCSDGLAEPCDPPHRSACPGVSWPSPPTGDTASDASTPAPLALARVLGPSPTQVALTPAAAPVRAMLVAPATAPPGTGAMATASPSVPSPLPSDATQRRMRQILDKQAVSCCLQAHCGWLPFLARAGGCL